MGGREGARKLALEKLKDLLGLIHNLFTHTLLIRRERAQRKFPGPARQGK
jgi:hypothetical protein